MLKWALLSLFLAIAAFAFYQGGLATIASTLALSLFWIFMAATIVLFVVGLFASRRAS